MNRYNSQAVAQSRQLKLMKDGVAGTSIVKKDGYWWVLGAPETAVPPQSFGRLMEDSRVVEAALDIDECAINQYDVGETQARSFSEIVGKAGAKPMAPVEHEPRTPAAGRWMTASELRVAENRGE